MKAVIIEQFGGPEVLRFVDDRPRPSPGDDEIVIDIAYTSVNPVEWKIRDGLLEDVLTHEFPLVPGWDAAGTVAEVGHDVGRFSVGDRVYAYCRKDKVHEGTYAEAIAVPEHFAAQVPDAIDLAQASTVPLAGLTAWQALFDIANLRRGQSVLVHAGAGGVGSFALQFARWVGARVYTTASAANHAYVQELGADVAIDYRSQDFVERIRAQEPDGIDVVFDLVGGEAQRRSYELLKRGGTLVSIVAIPDQATAESHGVRAAFHFVEPSGAQLARIGELIDAGEVRAPDIETLPLDQAVEAQERSKAGHVRGKLVLGIV